MDTIGKPKLITCLLPKGQGVLLAKRLKVEKDIDTANVANGRGFGMVHSISYGKWYEVDLMTLVVNQERAEEIFEWIYFRKILLNSVKALQKEILNW